MRPLGVGVRAGLGALADIKRGAANPRAVIVAAFSMNSRREISVAGFMIGFQVRLLVRNSCPLRNCLASQDFGYTRAAAILRT